MGIKKWAFKPRRVEVSRVEGFSDAVFAFAVTLLVVSLEVPHTFTDLAGIMRDIPPFAICFAYLFMVWWRHHNFFRRYGLEDPFSIAMTGVLLFVVLIYVYPLKFLFRTLSDLFTGGFGTYVRADGTREVVLPPGRGAQLMIMYSASFVAVFSVFAALYYHAFRKRAELGLDAHEIIETRLSVLNSLLMAAFGVLSILVAAIGGANWASTAGFLYLGIGPAQWALGEYGGRQHRRLDVSAARPADAPLSPAPAAMTDSTRVPD